MNCVVILGFLSLCAQPSSAEDFAKSYPQTSSSRPFSFTYDNKNSSAFLDEWQFSQNEVSANDLQTKTQRIWTDPETGLQVRCETVTWKAYPVTEWTLFLANNGKKDTPIIENVNAADITLQRAEDGEFVLHHNRGDLCTPDSFEPFETPLPPKTQKSFAPMGGRASCGAWPYYNLEMPTGGVIIAIGWPGQWSSSFVRDKKTGLTIRAGQELTHFRLHPGEEVRSPMILLMAYDGASEDAQNQWRRFMFDCNFPRPKAGKLSPAIVGCSGHQFQGLMCNQAGEIEFIDRYFEEKIALDYWWMDAGWYPCDGVGWPKVGTWEVDSKRYPDGIRAVADHIHQKGGQTVLWFEPERVHPGTWLYDTHPEWLLGKDGDTKLFNLGIREAREWLTNHVDGIISAQGVDLYRQDFNMDPLPYWRANDAKDRQGITEIQHIEGYLAYWDALRLRHPGMLIDSCASGGRRNDIETMRRAVPLLRTDCEFNADANQCHTYGFDQWLPYHECGIREMEPYSFRSAMGPMLGLVWDVRRHDLPYDIARTLIGQWREVAHCFMGDFHPLMPYTTRDDVWMVWQFHSRDNGDGIVQAFRRSKSQFGTVCVTLKGLSEEKRYLIKNMDNPDLEVIRSGAELMKDGLELALPEKPSSALIHYKPE